MDRNKLIDFQHNSAFTLNPKFSNKSIPPEIKKEINEPKEESLLPSEKDKNVIVDAFHFMKKKRQGASSIYTEINEIRMNIDNTNDKILESQNIEQKLNYLEQKKFFLIFFLN